MSFNWASKKRLTIQVKNYVGNSVLNIDTIYKNELGQDFSITNFKYYIGNICLNKSEW